MSQNDDQARNTFGKFDVEQATFVCQYGEHLSCNGKLADCRTCNVPIVYAIERLSDKLTYEKKGR